jgi:hypothetical protein
MKLSELKNYLQHALRLDLYLPDGKAVPAHFHVTEAGLHRRTFLDCGGVRRDDIKAGFQLWVANDVEHRLTPFKWLGIIRKAEPLFDGLDPEVELEYQAETIGRWGLTLQGMKLQLTPLQTDCLAPDHCGIPVTQLNVISTSLTNAETTCTPGGGCC